MPGAESQNRTGDTTIFSRVLYQLSYLGECDAADIVLLGRVDVKNGLSCHSCGVLPVSLIAGRTNPSSQAYARRRRRNSSSASYARLARNDKKSSVPNEC